MIYERMIFIRKAAVVAFNKEKLAICSLCEHAVVDQFRVSALQLSDWGQKEHLGCKGAGSNTPIDETQLNLDSETIHGKYSALSYDPLYRGIAGRHMGRITTEEYPRASEMNSNNNCKRFQPISWMTALKRTTLLPSLFLR